MCYSTHVPFLHLVEGAARVTRPSRNVCSAGRVKRSLRRPECVASPEALALCLLGGAEVAEDLGPVIEVAGVDGGVFAGREGETETRARAEKRRDLIRQRSAALVEEVVEQPVSDRLHEMRGVDVVQRRGDQRQAFLWFVTAQTVNVARQNGQALLLVACRGGACALAETGVEVLEISGEERRRISHARGV